MSFIVYLFQRCPALVEDLPKLQTLYKCAHKILQTGPAAYGYQSKSWSRSVIMAKILHSSYYKEVVQLMKTYLNIEMPWQSWDQNYMLFDIEESCTIRIGNKPSWG